MIARVGTMDQFNSFLNRLQAGLIAEQIKTNPLKRVNVETTKKSFFRFRKKFRVCLFIRVKDSLELNQK